VRIATASIDIEDTQFKSTQTLKLQEPPVEQPKTKSRVGYALLLIFSMAAILAIMLYREIPRVEFEAQRDKEQLLMDRGQEYSRAIALFVRKFKRFPASMEELENTNNLRFLRRRFPDPMTGKTDWRILHAGPGGVITDSILTGAKGASGGTGSVNNFITELGPMTGSVPAGDPAGVNLARRMRASDQPGAPGDDPGTGNGADTGSASNSGIPGYSGPVMVLPNGTSFLRTPQAWLHLQSDRPVRRARLACR